ncbi:MAG: dTDP-4-dehydrorhamnose reductase [Muribaculaceae bacterium]|nr:dTDP-4-dehydrorhamnose reductase [Muribaculaceae bacterium]MDE7111631.1 dTDP-4-dehydrorhamnose reductase [Muribaculaceae bacterium]
MKILVTGANGQLGIALRKIIQESKIADSTIFASREVLDITDADTLARFIADNDITHIVNCAAFTAVDRAEEDKAACTAINSDGVKKLAMAADNYGAKIIHISTDFVFDGLTHRAYSESDKVNPISHYGTSKRAGETALLALAPDSIIIRTSWLYSPDSNKNFPAKILEAARTEKHLKIVDDQIGSPTNADDLARAIVRILTTPQWFPGIYHYCNSGVCSRFDYAKVILRLAGLDSTVNVEPISTAGNFSVTPGAARPPFSALNTSKIRLTYGVETPHWIDSLSKALKK